ncbi:hypothetical protein [Paenibacillus woosongensis]|uniref:Uncharacterized protein n=1 Tax=Paenibacillus woosongensis TaxID=307580 RepID=A0A7X3CN38_9BACL|nr:hypothetical protein [Paenibacillus woosongensis]MUG44595.1 hypothetical protein [Paenibacillus woosongensis]
MEEDNAWIFRSQVGLRKKLALPGGRGAAGCVPAGAAGCARGEVLPDESMVRGQGAL